MMTGKGVEEGWVEGSAVLRVMMPARGMYMGRETGMRATGMPEEGEDVEEGRWEGEEEEWGPEEEGDFWVRRGSSSRSSNCSTSK